MVAEGLEGGGGCWVYGLLGRWVAGGKGLVISTCGEWGYRFRGGRLVEGAVDLLVVLG